ncbi:MAG: TetR/AcrR family transcriptional regulator, partial [Lacticaseibacillus paracasei]
MKKVVTPPEKVTRILKTATAIFGHQWFIKSK